MLRRRILESIFKFTSDPTVFNFPYGIQLEPEQILEIGQYVGLHQVPVLIDGYTYYKLSGTTNSNVSYVDVAMYNFTTTSENQEVTFIFKSSCENPNDFIGASKLDSTNKNNLAVKLTGVSSQTYTYTVATPGSHFIKVYYYQHNDGVTSGDNAGYFRMIPYNKVNYSYRYTAPNNIIAVIKSYYGWNLISKPDWVTLGKDNTVINTDTSGTHNISFAATSNAGAARSGNVVLKEKYGEQQLTLGITQEANPHPNDIILTRSKIVIPDDVNPTETIGIELVGNTSYTITNISPGLSISPLSNNQTNSNISVTMEGLGNPVSDSYYTFNIKGNAGTSKDIMILKEGTSLNCYCDCNSFDGCGCHSQTTFTHKDKTGNPQSCPKHDPAQGTACTSHSTCWCDCEGVVLCAGHCNNCPCNSQCSKCVGDCTSKDCSCYGQCNNCAADCTSKNCSCYGQCNNCAADCTSKNCSCYGQCNNCAADCTSKNCSCYGQCDKCAADCASKDCSCYGQCNDCTAHCLSKNCSCYGQCDKCGADCNGKSCTCYTQCSNCGADCNGKNCTCYSQCSNCGADCNGKNCTCYTQCNNCGADCNAKNCTCYGQCNDCASNCNGKNCTCYGQCDNCAGHCLSKDCSCYGQCDDCAGHCNGNACDCYGNCNWDCSGYDTSCSGDCSCHSNYTACDRDYDCYNCKAQCAGKYGCECDYGYHGTSNYDCNSVTEEGGTKYCSGNTAYTRKKNDSLYNCYKAGTYGEGCSGELRCASKSPSTYCDGETIYLGFSKGDGCIAFYYEGVSYSCSSVCETHNPGRGTCVIDETGCYLNDAPWDGCSNCDCWSFFPTCKDYYSRCTGHNICSGVGGSCPGNNICGGDCDAASHNYDCGGHCDGHNTTYNTSCGAHCVGQGGTISGTCGAHCVGDGTTTKTTCTSHCVGDGTTSPTTCTSHCVGKDTTSNTSCTSHCDGKNTTYNTSCTSHCPGKDTTYNTTCNAHCPGKDTTYDTTCNAHCPGEGTTYDTACNSHCPGEGTTYDTACNSHCPGYNTIGPEYCTCNRNINTECTSQNCSKQATCECNVKTYYPYCACDQYCKCDGYIIATVN